ncbi:MAG TPA: acyltransferase family protein [Thermoflexales bacterium]|nr:acyltransferase family protein [Thermoflexales bacterium]
MSEQKTRAEYYPALDGLRAIAVIGVILYHAGMPWMRGGFLGVESFFVISGFLITSLLLTDWAANGRINLKKFWQRRARRLLPAFYTAILGVLAFVVLFLPDEITRLRPDLLPALTFLTNWQYIFTNQSYFEAAGRPPLLRHLWSLAIEWQFYMVWPLVCMALFRLRKPLAIALALAGAAASSLWMAAQFVPDADPSRIYYGTDTRATGLLIGAALALFLSARSALPNLLGRAPGAKSKILDVAGLIALAVLVMAYAQLDELNTALYRGGFFAISTLTAVCVAASTQNATGWMARLLGASPLRWVGLRSYGLYLWHWPVFALTRPLVDVPLEGLPLFALRIAITLALTELSYRFIETPVRKGALGRAWAALRAAQGGAKLRFIAPVVVGVMALAALGAATVLAQPPTGKPSIADDQAAVAGLLDTPEPESTPMTEDGGRVTETPIFTETPTQIPTATPTPLPTANNQQPATQYPISNTTNTPTPTPISVPVTPTRTTAPTPTFNVITRTVDGRVQIDYVTPFTQTKRRIFAIGDSVMVAAAKSLWQVFGEDIDIDARTARPLKDGIKMLQDRRDKNLLGPVVVVHLGSNGPMNAAQMTELLTILKDVPRVVVLNLREPRTWEQTNNAIIKDVSSRYPNVVFVDWGALSISQPNLLEGDGIHLKAAGVKVYVQAIVAATKN